MRYRMPHLPDSKVELHLMQDKLIQALLHLCRILSRWVLFERHDLRMRGRFEHEDRIFPNFNSEHYRSRVCLCCQVFGHVDFITDLADVITVIDGNGDLDLHDNLAFIAI
jgi:hypothetical protein